MADSSHPDATAIAEVLAGRIQAFEQIVMRYESALLRVAHSRLGRVEQAEEAVQETFLNAFRSLHTYDSKYSFRTWLWSILLNQCHRQYKRSRRALTAGRTPPVVDVDNLPDTACSRPGPDAVAQSRERIHTLHELLADLPSRQSDALRLRFFGQLKYQEIADTMNCSLSTAKNRVRDGLVRLSHQLENDSGLRNTLHGDSP